MAAGGRPASREAALEKCDELRGGKRSGRRVGGRLLAMHEAVLGVGIILPDGRRCPLVQRLAQRGIGLHSCDMVVARLEDVNRAGDIGRERDRVVLLIGKPRVLDGGISGGARLHSFFLRGGNQRITPAGQKPSTPIEVSAKSFSM